MNAAAPIWRPVLGWEGLYEVSDLGQVRSFPRVDRLGRHISGRLLRPSRRTTARGIRCLTVTLCAGGRKESFLVSQLVTDAHGRPLPAGMYRAHVNGDRWDAALANLEFRPSQPGAEKAKAASAAGRAAAWARTAPEREKARAARAAARPVRASPPPLSEADAALIARHLDWMRLRGLAETSIYERRQGLRRLASRLPVPLLEADAPMLAAYRADMTVGIGAINSYMSAVRELYRWATAQHLIEASPAEGVAIPRMPRLLPRPIAEPDLLYALACAPDRIRPWLVLAGWAGLRAKEIALLRRECVLDLASDPVLIVACDATKGRRERVIPLSPFVLDELRAYRLPAAGWIFRRRDGLVGPNTPHTVSRLSNEHLRDCSIGATLHQLRHRFGTQAYRVKRDLRATQELMGHRDPSTTAGYAAFANADAIETVNGLPVPPGTLPAPALAIGEAS